MKLAYILGTFPSLSETFILREMTALRERGVEIEIFALNRRARPAKVHGAAQALLPNVHWRPALLSPAVLAAVSHYLCRTPRAFLRLLANASPGPGTGSWPRLKRWRNLAIAATFAREAERHGIAHVHAHFAFMPADVARLMAGLLGRPFSVSAHAQDIYTQNGPALSARLSQAAFVAVCTNAGRDHLLQHCPGLAPERVILVRHGLALAGFVPGKPAIAPTIVAVGRLEPKKGFPDLLKACSLLAEREVEFACRIVGDGPQRALLAATVTNDVGLRDRVQLCGPMTEEEMPAQYATAAVFVLPSIVTADGDRDGLPNVLLEAMAMGLPVVTTLASASVEVVRDGETGFLVAPGDCEALAGRLQELLAGPALRQRLGRAARECIARDFDRARTIAPLIARFAAAMREP